MISCWNETGGGASCPSTTISTCKRLPSTSTSSRVRPSARGTIRPVRSTDAIFESRTRNPAARVMSSGRPDRSAPVTSTCCDASGRSSRTSGGHTLTSAEIPGEMSNRVPSSGSNWRCTGSDSRKTAAGTTVSLPTRHGQVRSSHGVHPSPPTHPSGTGCLAPPGRECLSQAHPAQLSGTGCLAPWARVPVPSPPSSPPHITNKGQPTQQSTPRHPTPLPPPSPQQPSSPSAGGMS